MFDKPNMTGCEASFHQQNEIRRQLIELECFKTCITEIVENYIKMIDNKISIQDLKIHNAELFMKDNIQEVARVIIANGIEDGTFNVGVVYNEDTESMDIVLTGGNE